MRAALKHYGALLVTTRPTDRKVARLEVTLAEALSLAHEDATLAGSIPVVLWKNRGLDTTELIELALARDERQTLGFFFELTDELSGTATFESAAATLRDRRRRRLKNFVSRDGRFRQFEEELAQLNTPDVAARRWHFLMNMGLDSFQSYFQKGTGPTIVLAPRRGA